MENDQDKKIERLQFDIMPQDFPAAPAAPSGSEKPVDSEAEIPALTAGIELPQEHRRSPVRIITISILSLVVLAAAGFGAWKVFFAKNGDEAAKELQEPNLNAAAPVADKDSDNDGLTDKEEDAQLTEPQNPDTDGDGLSDGDEVNIYRSSPLLFDTDLDTYDDGREVARGFSPITNTPNPATQDELVAWQNLIAKYNLHEPTVTSLAVKKQDPQKVTKAAYENKEFNYALQIPDILAVRESSDGRTVGIHVASITPEDSNPATDPINVQIAVKTSGQTLEQWVDEQNQQGSYDKKEKVLINGQEVIKVRGQKNDICPSNSAYAARGDIIFYLRLSCNTNADFVAFFDDIVGTLTFTK